MGLKYSFRNISKIAIAGIFAIVLWHCKADDGEGGAYCFNCITTEPDSAEMHIKLSPNTQNPNVYVTISEDLYNPADTTVWDTTLVVSTSTLSFKVPTNRTYSVEAIYKDGNRVIQAVDGGVFDRQEQTGCETTCWQLIGGTYDVRLKEY